MGNYWVSNTIHLINNFVFDFQREILREEEVPKDMSAEVEEKRQELIECVSNADETLGEMFLEEKTPNNEQIIVESIFV